MKWTATHWEDVLAAADRLPAKGLLTAQNCLKAIFPPSLTSALRATRHPVVWEQLTCRGRLELLELALAVAVVGVDNHDLNRLRHADQYRGAAAELRALLSPARAGARLVRPPKVVGMTRCERIAEFPTGSRIAIEVKAPNQGEHDLDREAVEVAIFNEVVHQLDWLREPRPRGRVTLYFNSVESLSIGDRHGVDRERVRSLVADIAQHVNRVFQRDEFSQRIDVGLIGSIVISSDEQLAGLNFDASSESDAREAFRRIRRSVLNPAATQIKESGCPGVIILDLERDRAPIDARALVARWAASKNELGAVIMIERHTIDGKACNAAYVVPGPQFKQVVELLAGLDECSSGHLHYTPLSTQVDPCPATWLPSILVS
jgi:hypothetical protein